MGKVKKATMKMTNTILMLIFLLTISSCSTEINIGNHVDENLSLTLTIDKTNSETGVTTKEKREIKSSSAIFKKFIDWGINNQEDWNSTPASYIANVCVTQNDFRFLYNNDFVVVGFTNKKGELKQFSKPVQSGDLDFLTERNWKTYKDTINAGFILTFKYPENLIAESIQNGKCIGDKIEYPENDITNTMKWCIWMQDTSDYQIEHFISSEKSIFKGQVFEKRDTIIVNNKNAIRVILNSSINSDPYRQMIYLKKYSTLFEIINNNKADIDFEKFYNSIKIEEMKKTSP